MDRKDIPQANSFQVFFCGACPNAHVVFFDAHDRPLLQAIVSGTQARKMATAIDAHDPNFREIGED